MSTIQQTPTFSGIKINPNLAPLPAPSEAAQNATGKLGLHDIKSAAMTDVANGAGKPQLTAPQTAMNHDLMLTQLDGLAAPDNIESLDDLRVALLTTPEGFKQALTTVMQREDAITEKSAGNRALLDALVADDTEQRNLASAAQMLLGSSLLKEMNTARTGLEEGDKKVESTDAAKQREFVGIQTSDMMRFLLSMLRQVMADLNISERRINNMFSALSAEMTQKAAESTIREGQQIYHSAVIGFATSMAITGVGTGLQAGGLFKQNQAVKHHLKPANQHGIDAKKLSLNMHQTEATGKSTITRIGADGKPMQQATTPSPAQAAQFKQQQQQRVNEAQNQADLHTQKYEQQTNKYRTFGSVTDQMTRMSDNAGQLVSASNTSTVKEAEADKMIQNTAADVARGIASDKEKQIEKSIEAMKDIRGHISAMRDSTVRTNQSLVKG
ncbi:IpaC/SipC family type III secretion system effector [Yersinia hibernica]|uniref:IpaC/SipC family type III secretion system effector n=1 Tax=Yersinia hibernica TaxID=2339259 RepID=A0ABX5R4T4_9GAMM|nr:IpaC/SipC family type III secretion system effector [Yersinia hibernica]QAX80368.1 IpaC/SipC family type III secretion system effector [Yersinia hibernica]